MGRTIVPSPLSFSCILSKRLPLRWIACCWPFEYTAFVLPNGANANILTTISLRFGEVAPACLFVVNNHLRLNIPVSTTNRVNHSIGISLECRSANRIDNLHDIDNLGRIGSFTPILFAPYCCCKSDPDQHCTIGARYAKFRTSAATRPTPTARWRISSSHRG